MIAYIPRIEAMNIPELKIQQKEKNVQEQEKIDLKDNKPVKAEYKKQS